MENSARVLAGGVWGISPQRRRRRYIFFRPKADKKNWALFSIFLKDFLKESLGGSGGEGSRGVEPPRILGREDPEW